VTVKIVVSVMTVAVVFKSVFIVTALRDFIVEGYDWGLVG